MVRRAVAAVAAVAALIIVQSPPVAAAPLPLPDRGPSVRIVDRYPDQMPKAGIGGAYAAGGAGFLSLPYLNDGHFVSSTFDHCNPDYRHDGVICRFDGTVAYAGNGTDRDAPTGYAMSAGRDDYLYYDGHDGVDFGLYYEPVIAAADGVVSYADWSTPGCARCSFGRGVRIDHGNGFDTLYGHLWRIDVSRGQRVRRGEVVGISGTSGASTGEHLHFGVYHHATWDPVDPYGWSGPGADPWPHDAGNLWLSGAARSPAVPQPRVTARVFAGGPSGTELAVSWESPGDDLLFDVVQFTDDGSSRPLAAGITARGITARGEVGHEYWFLVSALSALGLRDSAATQTVSLFGEIASAR